MGEQYNIIALYIETRLVNVERMNEKITEAAIGNTWDNFLVLETGFDEIKKGMYIEVYPMHIYANSEKDIINVSTVQPYASAKIMLENLQAGLKKQEKVWYNKEGNVTNSAADDAVFFRQTVITPGYATITSGTKNRIESKITYHIKGNDFLYDGDMMSQTETGQVTTMGKFSDGIPLDTFKTFHGNGKMQTVYPVNGTMKVYTEAGDIVFEGPVVKGLGNGIFTKYTKGKEAAIYNYNNGIQLGLQQIFNEDGSKSAWFASPMYEPYGYLTEGLQRVTKNKLYGFTDSTGKVIIPIQYSYAANFKDGIAQVSIKDDYFKINRNGERVKEPDAAAPGKN
jgi:antitoxin component YwqK of YwqJK toxin-antitoxin module